jgi:hypothetical protein
MTPFIIQVKRGHELKLSFNEAADEGWTFEAAPGVKVSQDPSAPDAQDVADFTVTALKSGSHNVQFTRKHEGETRETRNYTIVVQP